MSRSVVAPVWIRLRETGRYRRPGQGPRRSTTARQDRYLRNMARRNRRPTASTLQQATNVRISDRTVHAVHMHESGLRSRRPA